MSSRMKFLMGLLAFTVAVRVLPCVLTVYDVKLDSTVLFYPWNFVPLMAVCLYSGAYVQDRRLSIGLPVLAMVIGDLLIWAITGQSFWTVEMKGWSPQAATLMATFMFLASLVCYVATVFLGTGLNRQPWPVRGLDAFSRGMVSEVLFFVVTNFAYFLSQNDFPHTLTGLVSVYTEAIPFAGKAFASTAFFSVLLFSPLAVPTTDEQRIGEPQLQSALSK